MNPAKIKAKARASIASNQFDEARSLLTELCEKRPSDADAWHLLGAIHGMLGQNEQAEICARKVIELNPGVAAAYNNLASSLLAQKKHAEAEAVVEKAVKLGPNDPQALNNCGSLLLARKEYTKAADCFRQAILFKPDYAEAHNNLGSALLGMDRVNEAVVSLEKALQLMPGYPDALYNYGQAAYQLGKYDIAQNAYSHVLKLRPDHCLALLGAAEVFKQKKMYEQAVNCYEAAMRIAPNLTDVYIGYATLLQKTNQHAKALEFLGKALEIDPDCMEALHYSGASMKELGNIEAATQFFNHALKVNPDFVQAKHMLATMGIADVPEKADPKYVSELFDAYAASFDENLVVDLQYRTPQELHSVVTPLLGMPEQKLDVLDLGCGTGLCAPLFKPWCKTLTGVDLSRKMVVKAEQLGLYDSLIIADLLEPLSVSECCYDLILAADVLNYFGDLEDVFMGFARSLRKGGIAAFSIELLQDCATDYVLHGGGRYAQSAKYIETIAGNAALSIHTSRETVLRKEKGEPVRGVIYILAKNGL